MTFPRATLDSEFKESKLREVHCLAQKCAFSQVLRGNNGSVCENAHLLCVWASLLAQGFTSCFLQLLTCLVEIPRPHETHCLTRGELSSTQDWRDWHVRQ